jgi:branched-chain amino acid transport system permease protein/neutral amino acid transport system permease protein
VPLSQRRRTHFMNLFIASLAFSVVTAATLSLAAVAFSLQFAVSNIFNLAFGAALTLSCYAAYFFFSIVGIEFWLAIGLAVLFSGLFAAGMSAFLVGPFIRRGASAFVLMIVTFSLGTIIDYGLDGGFRDNSFTLPFGGSSLAIHAGPFELSGAQLVVVALAVVMTAGLAALLHRTRLGIAIRAIVDNRMLAGASGVPTRKVTTVAWFVTGLVTGIAGLALAASTSTVNGAIGDNYLLLIIPAAMLGGLGSIWGAIAGSLVISLADNLWGVFVGTQYEVLIGLLVLMVVIMIRPGGLAGVISRGWGGT